jgi:hypothetical protein
MERRQQDLGNTDSDSDVESYEDLKKHRVFKKKKAKKN